jgi:hypothetical protein
LDGGWGGGSRLFSHFSYLLLDAYALIEDDCIFDDAISHVAHQLLNPAHVPPLLLLMLEVLLAALQVKLLLQPRLQLAVLLAVLPQLPTLATLFLLVVVDAVVLLLLLLLLLPRLHPCHYAHVETLHLRSLRVLMSKGHLLLRRVARLHLRRLCLHADFREELMIGLFIGVSAAKPEPSLMFLRLPLKPVDSLLVLPVIVIVLAVLFSDVGLETIALPSWVVVGYLPSPDLKVQLIFYGTSEWLWGVKVCLLIVIRGKG